MRLGLVRGHVVLSACVPEFRGSRLLIVEPMKAENLAKRAGGGGKALVVADHLSPGQGQTVAFVEGSEAANPYWPEKVPVDAYCSFIVDGIDYHPPAARAPKDNRK